MIFIRQARSCQMLVSRICCSFEKMFQRSQERQLPWFDHPDRYSPLTTTPSADTFLSFSHFSLKAKPHSGISETKTQRSFVLISTSACYSRISRSGLLTNIQPFICYQAASPLTRSCCSLHCVIDGWTALQRDSKEKLCLYPIEYVNIQPLCIRCKLHTHNIYLCQYLLFSILQFIHLIPLNSLCVIKMLRHPIDYWPPTFLIA